jgi:hypothetical protein
VYGVTTLLAFSGGKDSTACAYAMADAGEVFSLFFTPTANEPDALYAHICSTATTLQRPLIIPPGVHSLAWWIRHHHALPNHRQRWCTRLIKLLPTINYLQAHPNSTLAIGLRADEPLRTGLFGPYCTYRYPLRERGWGINAVRQCLTAHDVTIPPRTNCHLCYAQRLSEWYTLWITEPEVWATGEQWEAATGHTFRSPSRDTWPASMSALRRVFEEGRLPRSTRDDNNNAPACRLCTL